MTMVNGIGTRLYGRTWHHDGSYYIATEWFCILWLPFFPIRSYKVRAEYGTDLIIFSRRKYELEALPNLYRPHLRAYFFTMGVVFAAAMWILSGPMSGPQLMSQPGYGANEAGLAAMEAGQYESAIVLFGKAISADSVNSIYNFNPGQAFLFKREFDQSLLYFDRARQLDPDWIEPYLARAGVFENLEKFSMAAVECKRALEIEPNNRDLLERWGDNCAAAGKYDDAVEAYTDIIKLFPYDYAPYLDRAYAYYSADQSGNALADIDSASVRDPNVSEIKYVKALILEVLGREDEALDYYRAVIQDSAGLSPGQIEQARQFIERGKTR